MTVIDKPGDLLERLHAIGRMEDEAIPLADAALMLAALDREATNLAPYREHLHRLTEDVRDVIAGLRRGMSATDATARALVDVIAARHSYVGDSATYDDPQNADLISVIDRRRGLPVALGIIYIEVAHRLDVPAHGLDTPGHFLLSVGENEYAAAIDPFTGVVLNLSELRIAPPAGPAMNYGPVGRRDVLLRLLNNIHVRAQAGKDSLRTLTITERMVLIAPGRADLWLELSKANEAVGKMNGAIRAAQTCVKIAGSENSVGREAAFVLQGLKRIVN